ncbi:MAG: PAS domain-containing protein [Actinomycetota bacterium]
MSNRRRVRQEQPTVTSDLATPDQERLQELVQALDAIVWEAEPVDLRFTFLSRRAENLLGYPIARWLAEPDLFASHFHPEDRERVLNGYRAAVNQGTDHSLEYRVVAADGRVVWLRDRIHVARDSKGRALSLRGVMVDSTRRKEAEDRLRESEDRYRRLVHLSPDAIMVHSEGKLVFANIAAAQLLGAETPDVLVGKPALDIVDPDYHDAVAKRMRQEEEGTAVSLLEERFIRLDGAVIEVEVAGIPFIYQGKPAGQIVVRDITSRKETERQLQVTESRYRALVEQIPAILYIVSLGPEKTMYIGPQIEEILGISQVEYLGRPQVWFEALHPEDRERAGVEWDAFVKDPRGARSSDYRMIDRDGRTVWIHDRSVAIADEEGRPSVVQGIMFDLTEQKQAELQLRRRDAILEAVDLAAERFLRAPEWTDVIDEVLEALGTAADAGRVTLSELYRDEDGVLRASVRHEWTARGVHSQKDNPAFQEAPLEQAGWQRWVDILDSGEVVHGPTWVFPDGEREMLEQEGVRSALSVGIFVEGARWGSISVDDCTNERDWSAAEIDALKAAAETLGAAVQRKRTEEMLQATEAKYRALVEQIPAVLYVDRPGAEDQTIYISPQVEPILGLAAADWLSNHSLWYEHLHPDDRETAWRTYRKGVANGQPFSYEYRLVTDRGTIWVRDDAVVLPQDDGAPLVQGVMFDVTEEKLAEEALLESERREREAAKQLRALDAMKNTFLAAVSHELRSPLTAVLGLALTLEQQELAPEEQRDLLQRLASNARKLDRLLTDLLDIDRLARGTVTPQLHTTDVGALVRRTIQAADYLGDRSIHVEATPVVASVDAAKVERIVENLLVNTSRHTTEDTNVYVRVSEDDEGVLIVVEDDGPGVPEEIREAIFEPFRQGPTLSGHAPGTGIGLSLVQQFAELHGGRSWVEDRPGGGASFRVHLPQPGSGNSQRS